MILSDNIWWERKAKMKAEKRLLSNVFHAHVMLLWYSFFAVLMSIYYLKYPQDSFGSVSWIAYSVLVLCMSGFINGFSFKERAHSIKECYENLKTLYAQALQAENSKQDATLITQEYEKISKASENHRESDYIVALCSEYLSSKDKKLVDPHPTFYHWIMVSKYLLTRFLILSFFYLLPFIILCAINANIL